MNRFKTFVARWAPALIWMAVIFMMSSRQSIKVDGGEVANFTFFKSAHVVEYAILAVLVFRGFYLSLKKNANLSLKYSFITSLVYSVSDEFHQSFVPTREGHIRDIFIDMIGIVVALYVVKTSIKTIKKFL